MNNKLRPPLIQVYGVPKKRPAASWVILSAMGVGVGLALAWLLVGGMR